MAGINNIYLWDMYSKTPMDSWTLHAYKYSKVYTCPSWSPETNARTMQDKLYKKIYFKMDNSKKHINIYTSK